MNRVNPKIEIGMIIVADVKRLAAFLNAEYEEARRRAIAGGALNFTWGEWADEIGVKQAVLSKYRLGNLKEGPRTDILKVLVNHFKKIYPKDGRKRVLQAADIWGDDD